jgi:tellurite resistance protein TehA-like permease
MMALLASLRILPFFYLRQMIKRENNLFAFLLFFKYPIQTKCRLALFKKSMRRFNVAWWAYSLPVTSLALASAEYAQEVKGGVAHLIMLSLSALSFMVILDLLVFTAFNSKMLFSYDDPILITSVTSFIKDSVTRIA